MSTIGELVRRALEAKGLTQGQLTVKTGISQSHISKLLAGEHTDARASTLVALAEGLDLDPIELLYAAAGKEPPERPPRPLPPHIAALRELIGDEGIQRFVALLRRMPDDKRRRLLELFEALADLAR